MVHIFLKSVLASLLITLSIFSGYSQASARYDSKVSSIDSIMHTLYDVISGDKGEERNWELFEYIFTEDARLIPSGKTDDGQYRYMVMSPADYIQRSGSYLVSEGFHETEINRKTQVFGNIAHVFSTYETFHDRSETEPFMRGINSIQLFNDGNRWWIMSIYWTQETDENPIPSEYLEK